MVDSVTSKYIATDANGNTCVLNVIDGEPILLPPEASYPVISSASQQAVHHAQTATVDVATRAVEAAAKTFRTYRKTPVHERRAMLLRAADLFEQKADESSRLQMLETSCDAMWAGYAAVQASSFCREIAGALAAAVVGEIQPSYYGFTHLAFKEPVGPVLIIAPWNAAVVLCLRGIANALAAGCTVVFKGSELCPWTHLFVTETLHEAGFPPGAVNFITADRSSAGSVTEAVIAHPALRKIEFVGSAAVGRIIGGIAAKHLKPIVLELGDQSPAIILEDADLAKAAAVVAFGTTFHHGQACFSTERIILHSSVKDKFVELLCQCLDGLAPKWMAVDVSHAEKARGIVQEAVDRGARFVYGSAELIEPNRLAPSILENVDPTSALSTAEAFAPTALLVTVDSDEQAVEEANSRHGGLSAAVWTNSFERGLNMARELDFGMVQVNNSTLFAEPAGPCSNIKGSGWGSNNGRYGIENFLYSKAVSLVSPTAKLGP